MRLRGARLPAPRLGEGKPSRYVPLFVAAMVVLAGFADTHGRKPGAPSRRIAVFGSSVANGTGDDLGKEGYTGRLRELLAPRGWEVLNQSRGGDNTRTLAPRFAPEGTPDPKVRYLLPVNPSYVLLGLSLGNEGIQSGTTKAEKDAIYSQFEAGMRGFVERSRQNHVVPIITLCYTRNDFTAVEYEYTRRMNLLINSWDVSSVNFLGAVDDGTGKWAKGFWHDALHPNAAGHAELVRTFVPTLFEAIERGKPAPKRMTTTGFARVAGGTPAIWYTPDDSMHPFAFGVTLRAHGDGSVALINGSALSLASEVKREDEWHHFVLSHYTARGETLFFVDGKLAGTTTERLEPKRFALGGTTTADVKDLLVYRSALNADEVSTLEKGTLLQASLEVYSPLDTEFQPGKSIENRAQSLTSAMVGKGRVSHVAK